MVGVAMFRYRDYVIDIGSVVKLVLQQLDSIIKDYNRLYYDNIERNTRNVGGRLNSTS